MKPFCLTMVSMAPSFDSGRKRCSVLGVLCISTGMTVSWLLRALFRSGLTIASLNHILCLIDNTFYQL